MLVFVYGTLKLGNRNNKAFLQNAKFISRDSVPDHTLILAPSFPYAINWKGGRVEGQLFEVDKPTMEGLDMLEGFPEHYSKKTIKTESGRTADIYYLEEVKAGPKMMAEMIKRYHTGPIWTEAIGGYHVESNI